MIAKIRGLRERDTVFIPEELLIVVLAIRILFLAAISEPMSQVSQGKRVNSFGEQAINKSRLS